jgi:hypothetical protein
MRTVMALMASMLTLIAESISVWKEFLSDAEEMSCREGPNIYGEEANR